MLEDIKLMQFPMVALGKVEVAGAEYQAGKIFDALDAGSYRFHEQHQSARPLTEKEKRLGVVDPAVEDQPAAAAASEGGKDGANTEGAASGAKGAKTSGGR